MIKSELIKKVIKVSTGQIYKVHLTGSLFLKAIHLTEPKIIIPMIPEIRGDATQEATTIPILSQYILSAPLATNDIPTIDPIIE